MRPISNIILRVKATTSLKATALSLQIIDHILNWDTCTRCEIGYHTSPKVHTRGVLPCQVLMIGEAPGKEEVKLGYPFMGMSGDNVNSWIEWCSRMWSKETSQPFTTYALVNTCACRPCDKKNGPNRKPTDLEQQNCAPKFRELLTMANPSSIILLGAVARDYWLSRPYHEVNTLPYAALAHPSPLRVGGPNTGESRKAREQMLAFLIANYLKRK